MGTTSTNNQRKVVKNSGKAISRNNYENDYKTATVASVRKANRKTSIDSETVCNNNRNQESPLCDENKLVFSGSQLAGAFGAFQV